MTHIDNMQNSEITEEMRNRYAQLKGMETSGELADEERQELDQLRPRFESASE
jgi:hypothetical protein